MDPGWPTSTLRLLKSVRLSEAHVVDLRFEAFNVFNHAQFFGARR